MVGTCRGGMNQGLSWLVAIRSMEEGGCNPQPIRQKPLRRYTIGSFNESSAILITFIRVAL